MTEAQCKISIPPSPPTDGTAEIWTEGAFLKPNTGKTLLIPFTEAKQIEAANYRVNLSTRSETFSIFGLGSNYNHFTQKLTDAWGDALAKALLMNESNPILEQRASLSQPSLGAQAVVNCRLRLQPTSLVILPADSFPRKIPLSAIKSAVLENYRLRISTVPALYEFSKMGNQTQFIADKLTATQRALEGTAMEAIRSMIPSVTYEELRGLSMMMLEGQAALHTDVGAVSPRLWPLLEKKVAESPLAETYAYLSSLGEKGQEAVGLRKTQDNIYVWFLILVRGSPSTGGNALVMEVTSESGHATYLFKVVNRRDFANCSQEQFQREGAQLQKDVNEAMIATGFRREPIYLSEDQLSTPAYAKYLYAAENLEPLEFLRERFFARIVHHSFDQWKSDLTDALVFNTGAAHESSRWSKSELDLFENQPSTTALPTTEGVLPATVQATPFSSSPPAAPSVISSSSETTQPLSLQSANDAFMSQPILANMAERVLTVNRMEGYEEGKVRLWLSDNEMNHETAVVLRAEDASRLAAFPGTKVKLSLQKV